MANQIPGYQLALMRNYPQMSDVYLIIQQPQVAGGGGTWTDYLWSCRINADVTDDEVAELTVNTSSGSATLLDGMTVMIGSSYGEYDKGLARIRTDQSVTAGTTTLKVSVSSEYRENVVTGDYVVVLDEFKLWQRIGRIEVSGSDVTWYKDYDIGYDDLPGATDADKAVAMLPPTPTMSSHGVKFVEVGASTAQFYFDWSGSYANAPGQTVSTWTSYCDSWSSAAQTPGWQTINKVTGLAGERVTLEVNDGNGDATTLPFRRGVRYMFTVRRPGQTQGGDPSNAEAITQFRLNGAVAGSFDQGYSKVGITLFGDAADKYKVIPGALIVLFTDDWYAADAEPYLDPSDGLVNQSVSPVHDRENILFVGNVKGESIEYDPETQTVSFECQSVAEQTQQAINAPITISNYVDEYDWIYTPTLTVPRAFAYNVTWHTTLSLIADVYNQLEEKEIKAQDFTQTSIYSMLNGFVWDRLYARLLANKHGMFYAVRDVNMDAYGTVDTLWSMDDGDWLDKVSITRRIQAQASAIDAGGLYYDSALNAVIPYLSRAPGLIDGHRGAVQPKNALAIDNQAELNTLAGRQYAALNAEYPSVKYMLGGNWRWLDIVPQRAVAISIPTERETVQGKLLIRAYENAYDGNAGCIFTSIDGMLETDDGVAGVTIVIPETVPKPEYIYPPRVEQPTPEPPIPEEERYEGIIAATNPEGAFHADPFTLPTLPTWYDMQNSELTAVGSKNISTMCVVDWNTSPTAVDEKLHAQCYCAFYTYDPMPAGSGHWTEGVENYEIAALAGAGATYGYWMMDTAYDATRPGYAWGILRCQNYGGPLGYGFSMVMCSTQDGWENLTLAQTLLYQNDWHGRMGRAQIAVANDGTSQTVYCIYASNGPSGGGYWIKKSTDGGLIWTTVWSRTPYTAYYDSPSMCIKCAPSNPLYIYATISHPDNDMIYSTDGGSSWNVVNLPYLYTYDMSIALDFPTKVAIMDQLHGVYEWQGGSSWVQFGDNFDWWTTGDPDSYGGWARAMRVMQRDASGDLIQAIVGGYDRANYGKLLAMGTGGSRTVITNNWNTVASNDWVNCIAKPELGEYA